MPGAESGRVCLSRGAFCQTLLVAYVKEFRNAYGPQMVQVFKDICREERRSGAFRPARLRVRTHLEPGYNRVCGEKSKAAMKWKILMPLALILGLLIALVDSSPGRDDTGISATAVFTRTHLINGL